jgi:hypothetical protein
MWERQNDTELQPRVSVIERSAPRRLEEEGHHDGD